MNFSPTLPRIFYLPCAARCVYLCTNHWLFSVVPKSFGNLIPTEFHLYQVSRKPQRLILLSSLHRKQNISSVILFSRSFHQTSTLLYAKPVPFILSDIGEGIVEVHVKEWYVKPGDKVAQFDPVCEVQSDKASVTISSRYDGTVGTLHYKVDDVAKVGTPLLDIIPDNEALVAPQPSIQKSAESLTVPPIIKIDKDDAWIHNKSLATPAVRKIAKENKINLSEIKGTGKDGRVMKEDVLSYLGNTGAHADVIIKIPTKPEQAKVLGGIIQQELVGIRKAMSKTMTEAWKIPHFSYSDEIDVTDLIAARKAAKLDLKAGVKVTYMPFILKAVSLALLKYPLLNSHMDVSGTTQSIFEDHNVGIAVDSPQGLVVPNVKKVDKLSLVEIAKELHRLQSAAGQGRFSREDLSGGTITVSNIGNIGGVHAQPIILPPQVAIAAVGKIQTLPRYDENFNLVPRSVIMMTWSADHRALDGATVARFSNLVKTYLSSPKILLQL